MRFRSQLLSAVICWGFAAQSHGANLLKSFEMKPTIDAKAVLLLNFAQDVSRDQVSFQKERGFVQLILSDTSLAKAQVKDFEASHIKKVFIYPFAKNETRVRAFLRLPETLNAENVVIKQAGAQGLEISLAQGINKASLPTKAQKSMSAILKGKNLDLIEEKILADVLSDHAETTEALVAPANKEPVAAVASAEKEKLEVKSEAKLEAKTEAKALIAAPVPPAQTSAKIGVETPATAASPSSIGLKTEPSRGVARVALALILVMGVMIGFLMLLKRYGTKLNLSKLPFGKGERLIQVVATHRLGRNQAISLVKVTGEYLVLGISGENINMLATLGKDLAIEKNLEERFWGGTFEKFLTTYSKPDPAPSLTQQNSMPASELNDLHEFTQAPQANVHASVSRSSLDFRDKIRNRMGHLKPLNQ